MKPRKHTHCRACGTKQDAHYRNILNGQDLYFKAREDLPSDDYVEKALDQVVEEIVPLVLEK
jgi:hypothetical protein